MEEWGRNFGGFLEWALGNGNKILFWHDVWMGYEALKSRFPRLFYLSNNKDAFLDSFGECLRLVELGSSVEKMHV